MAVPKKGWRKITVRNARFFWRTLGTDWEVNAVVVTEAAFVSGKRAQQLLFTLDYDLRLIGCGDGFRSYRQRAVISPGVVRMAIELSLDMWPPFTGLHGLPDVLLPASALAELQAAARVEPVTGLPPVKQ